MSQDTLCSCLQKYVHNALPKEQSTCAVLTCAYVPALHKNQEEMQCLCQYPACKACTVWGWETHTEDTNGSWQCFAEHETNDSPWTFGVQYFHAKPIFQDAPLLRGIDFGTAMAILGSKLVIEQTEWI